MHCFRASTRFVQQVASILLAATASSVAQPTPRLTELSREWFQRGTTNELDLTGDHIRDAHAIRISGDSGVTATLVPRRLSHPDVALETSCGGITVGEPGITADLVTDGFSFWR